MSALDPESTTAGDLCIAACKESGGVGVGQTPGAEDINDAWSRLQWMLQQWERKRWLVYHLVELQINSTGALTYTVGPGGDFDTGPAGTSVRPAKLEFARLVQITSPSPNQVYYPLRVLQSYEDYAKIALPTLMSFPGCCFLDTGWPLATLRLYPVAQANIYAINLGVLAQLPPKFGTLATKISLPYEYYSAILYNLALRMRSRWQIPTFPGDPLPGQAKNALNVIRGANTQIAALGMPTQLTRPGLYNIFSDRNY